MEDIYFSIVMPAYNSALTIEKALKSVKNQNFNMDKVEILVIDGGSQDETLHIAEKYGAKILHNPKRLPEYAKLIGFNCAKGKFVIKMDSDEEFIHGDILQNRYDALEKTGANCLIANELVPICRSISAKYLNYCGDPFSFFVYSFKQTQRQTYKNNISRQNENLMVFNSDDIMPIGDGGTTTVNIQYAKKFFADRFNDESFASSVFTDILLKDKKCVCLDDDKIYHYVNANLKVYLSKLRFRVINNVFGSKDSGYINRQMVCPVLKKRRKLFYLYALSFLGPLFDGVKLTLIYKDLGMMMHIFYLYYVCVFSAYCFGLKACGKTLKNKSYGK